MAKKLKLKGLKNISIGFNQYLYFFNNNDGIYNIFKYAIIIRESKLFIEVVE